MGINLKVHGFSLRIVNVYSPTDCGGTKEQKDKFYTDLKKASKKHHKHQKLIIAGDFNATTDVAKYKSNYNGNKITVDHSCNDNGQRLKQLCRSEKLNISSSFFKHRLLHRYTWYSNDNKTKKSSTIFWPNSTSNNILQIAEYTTVLIRRLTTDY